MFRVMLRVFLLCFIAANLMEILLYYIKCCQRNSRRLKTLVPETNEFDKYFPDQVNCTG